MNYYNEWDPQAAAWLRELISERLIPRGLVDERSITEVKAEDLEGFTQCHFFAGIGGWSLALQLAGVDHRTPLWTGSPPCQPFSVAGKQLGQLDERHLAPAFMRLVDQCRPPVLFGEQVAAAIGKHWLDDLFTELERQGYACGAAVLPACSVGAPHKRDRLFFGAHRLANPGIFGNYQRNNDEKYGRKDEAEQSRLGSSVNQLADAVRQQFDGGRTSGSGRRRQSANRCITDSANPNNSFWSDADWLGCRDGKFRPVEAWSQSLVNGLSDSLGYCSDNCITEAWEEIKNVCDAKETRPGEALQQLRLSYGAQIKRLESSGGFDGLYPAPILLAFVRELWRKGREVSESLPLLGEEAEKGLLRGLWEFGSSSGSPCRRGLDEQWGGKPSDIVHILSPILARYASQAWPEAYKAHAEIGFPLGKEIPARVGRLRGYGNAIVPQVAAEFIAAFMGATSDAAKG